MNLKKILIAVDNSLCAEKAARTGYEMAEKFGCEVALINIIEPAPVSIDPNAGTDIEQGTLLTPLFLEDFDNIEENSHVLLREVAEKFGNGIKTSFLSVLDTPAHGIVQQAAEWHADLIVIGTYGRTGLYHFLMGSVAEHVARKSACPVLIVPNKYES